MSTGEDLSMYFVNEMSWTVTLPAPAPVPWCVVPDWLNPQLQARTSISSLWAESTDSPLMSPILMNISTAMPTLLYVRLAPIFDHRSGDGAAPVTALPDPRRRLHEP